MRIVRPFFIISNQSERTRPWEISEVHRPSNRFVACVTAGGKLRPAFTLRLLFLHVGDTPPKSFLSENPQQNEQSKGKKFTKK